MFYTVISHERAPVNTLRPNGLRALNNGPLVANHCIKHSKPFVIPIVKVSMGDNTMYLSKKKIENPCGLDNRGSTTCKGVYIA